MAAVLAEVAEEKAELEESVLVLGRKVATLEGGTLNAPPFVHCRRNGGGCVVALVLFLVTQSPFSRTQPLIQPPSCRCKADAGNGGDDGDALREVKVQLSKEIQANGELTNRLEAAEVCLFFFHLWH